MRRLTLLLPLLLAGAVGLVEGHGASRGLHLHVEPDPIESGATLTVTLEAAKPMVSGKIAVTGGEPVAFRLDPPARRHALALKTPATGEATLSLQAEAETADGGVLRAAAVVRVE